MHNSETALNINLPDTELISFWKVGHEKPLSLSLACFDFWKDKLFIYSIKASLFILVYLTVRIVANVANPVKHLSYFKFSPNNFFFPVGYLPLKNI